MEMCSDKPPTPKTTRPVKDSSRLLFAESAGILIQQLSQRQTPKECAFQLRGLRPLTPVGSSNDGWEQRACWEGQSQTRRDAGSVLLRIGESAAMGLIQNNWEIICNYFHQEGSLEQRGASLERLISLFLNRGQSDATPTPHPHPAHLN
ncbi:hypothetical protein JZ751_029688 [Albula glossodonta]|uniref:Uncharacterized protein n=1 Tax=Albula glossodonta TaxID=121402 RepID=A0A8T2NHV0_9TELE|nr:hypothetical protein JZ751_029688 [Albula glossodonta]